MTRPAKFPLALVTVFLTVAGVIWAGGTTIAGKAGLDEVQEIDRKTQRLEATTEYLKDEVRLIREDTREILRHLRGRNADSR